MNIEKLKFEFDQASHNMERERVNIENEIRKKLEEERQQNKGVSEFETRIKVNETKMSNEKLKEEHKKEMQLVKEAYEKTIHDLKCLYVNVSTHPSILLTYCIQYNRLK